MKKLYEKNELTFAIMWIVIYCVVQSIANLLSDAIGIDSSVTAILNIVMAAVLLAWVRKNNLSERYGLCRGTVPARKFLWYIPLIVMVSRNLWNGAALNLPLADTVCYIISMLCVGFLEELIFRGFLFKAIARDNLKQALIISSVTFGLGHLLNLVNGSGMALVTNLCQVFGAIAIGFLFVIIFYRGGSLLPCIFTHSAINAISVFANEAVLTDQRRIVLSLIHFVIVAAYILFLTKSLPDKRKAGGAQ